jgi:uncharacterized membrane protein YdbT with pleckstrin-like domain
VENELTKASVFYDANPSMFKNRPLGFIISILLVPAFGLGVLILLYWFIQTKGVRLRIVGDEIELEKGLISKSRIDLDVRKIRSVHVAQRFWQRVFGVGNIQIYTTGDEPELTLSGMPEPNVIRDYVKKQTRSD